MDKQQRKSRSNHITKTQDFDWSLAHVRVEHELVGEELNQTSVHENTSTDGVENSVDKLLVAGIIRLGSYTSSNANGSRQSEDEPEQVRHPLSVTGPRSNSQTRTKTETLKHLVKDKDYQKNRKLIRGNGTESETDKDAVKHDSELKNEDGKKLASKSTLRIALLVLAAMGKMLIASRGVAGCPTVSCLDVGAGLLLGNDFHGGVELVGVVVLHIGVAETSGEHFDKEHDNDGHEGDGLGPVVAT
ncbi:hypothetical protein HG531_007438 [Fusarium graminearum]|nr:hypothetical protein HG531_007438 [Fusarium graminearum]